MNERHEISFLLTVEDYVAFNVFGLRRLPFWQRHLGSILLGSGLLLGILMMFTFAFGSAKKNQLDQSPLFLTIPGFLFLLALGGVVVWLMHPSQIRRRVRALVAKPQNRHLLGEKTYLIGPQGITSIGQDGKTLIRWDMIEEIEETDDHVFFFFAQRTALLLPRRAGPTERDFEDFMSLAWRYYEGAESESPPQPESISPQPTRDEAIAPDAGRESEPPTVLRVHDEQGGACRDLSFVLTVEDHIAFHNLIFQRLPFWRRYLPVWLLPLLILAGGVMAFMTQYDPRVPLEKHLLSSGLAVCPMLVVIAVLSLFMKRIQAAKRARQVRTLLAHPKNQKFVTEMTITITPEELIAQSMTGTSSLRWERIHEIVVTADHAFFFHAEQRAIVVPKRPLQAKEFEAFVDLARQYHEGRLACEETVPKGQAPEQEYRIKE
jgi:hypothetical protein